MTRPKGFLTQALISGSLASVLSMLTLMVRAQRETGQPVAPANAPSHWLFGDEAIKANGLSLKYTGTGLLIHHASSMLWGFLYDRLFCGQRCGRSPLALTAGAVGVTAVAAVVDLKLVPDRLTPGFEHRVSRETLVMTYGAFAAGLALAAILSRQRR